MGSFNIKAHSHLAKANAKARKIKERSEEIKKIQRSKKIFAFAFSQCERTLMMYYTYWMAIMVKDFRCRSPWCSVSVSSRRWISHDNVDFPSCAFCFQNLYPGQQEKAKLAEEANMSVTQLSKWYVICKDFAIPGV